MTNRPAVLNRVVLAITGALLVCGAAFALAAAAGIDPWVGAGVLIPAGYGVASWVPVAAAVAAILVALASAAWLVAQFLPQPRTRAWLLQNDPEHGATAIAAGAATGPVTADIESYPGVRSVRAQIAGSPAAPPLTLRIATNHGADLAVIQRRVRGHALARLGRALECEQVPAVITFEPTVETARVR